MSGDPAPPTDEELRARLTPTQYHVTQEKGTEPPFTGEYWDRKTPGSYSCVCCGQLLYHSDHKYESGCGWPSYFQAASDDAITEVPDRSLGMHRIELLCSRCGAHLGHVFPDGPPPTGMRHCINSASLKFEPK